MSGLILGNAKRIQTRFLDSRHFVGVHIPLGRARPVCVDGKLISLRLDQPELCL